ncbi:MAG: hypothetical protein WDO14_18070 [Bacteroidota bacterium]
MNNFSQVLTRTLTTEFYRVNAMFFLVAIGFCFGFMRGVEHIALAGFFVGSPWLAMIPVGVWILYTIKVVIYNRREVKFEKNWFLYSLPLGNAIPAYVTVAVGQLAPIIAYGSFLFFFALKQQQWLVMSIILVSLGSMIIITTWRLGHSLTYPLHEKSTPTPIRKLDQLFAKPAAWIFSEGIVRSQPGMVYVTKIVACLVIYGATQLYLYDQYDERLYLMAACAAFSANLALVFQYQKLEVVDLMMFRSLPIPFTNRMITFVVTMLILCFPEIAILATNRPEYLSITNYFSAILFGISLLLAGYGKLYVRSIDFDSFTRQIFFVSMGLLLTILFKVPILVATGILFVAGFILIKKNYYYFQP